MEELQVTARLRIRNGQLSEFKAVAEKCVASVRENDTGTLQYDWFFNEDETECVVRERYRDSDAIMEHMANLGSTLEELLAVCDLSVEVFGHPSAELMAATEGMSVGVYKPFVSA
jgi:quinol monooxygenase YgiN